MSLDEFGTDMPKHKGGPRNRPAAAMESTVKEIDAAETPSSGDLCQYTSESRVYFPASKTSKRLPAGVYVVVQVPTRGLAFCRQDVIVDDILEFPDSLADKIFKEIGTFWDSQKLFRKYGFCHRRGYLLYGPAGSGKSCIVQKIISDVVKADDVVFICENPVWLSNMLRCFRQIEPTRRCVCIFEDIDATITEHGENQLLSLLDGENQIDYTLNIATTNYPERLDKRIVARPRRFDRVYKIPGPDAMARKLYLKKKLNIEDHELETWVKETEEFSFASLSELVISVKCLGNEFGVALKALRDLSRAKASSAEFEKSDIGFGK